MLFGFWGSTNTTALHPPLRHLSEHHTAVITKTLEKNRWQHSKNTPKLWVSAIDSEQKLSTCLKELQTEAGGFHKINTTC